MERKLWKKITALTLTFVMLSGSQVMVRAAEDFSFTDGTEFTAEDEFIQAGIEEESSEEEMIQNFGSAAAPFAEEERDASETMMATQEDYLPLILTENLPDGKVSEQYAFQLQADGNGKAVTWSTGEKSKLPEGVSFSDDGVLSGVPKESGSFVLFAQAEAGGLQSVVQLYFSVFPQEEVLPDYRISLTERDEADLGVIAVGTEEKTTFYMQNSGAKPIHLVQVPNSRWFDLSWDREEKEVPMGSWFGVEIKTKKGLSQGKYEETLTVTTQEGAECPMPVRVVVGPASEKDYDLICTPEEVKFTDDDFYDPEFRVEILVYVKNIGQKNTRITVDSSEMKYFDVTDQRLTEDEDEFEQQDTKKSLKPGESFTFFVIPKQDEGTYQEVFYFCTEDGSRFPVKVSMSLEKYQPLFSISPLTIAFEEKTLKYQVLPDAETITVKNTCKERITLSQSRGKGLRVGKLSKNVLEPGEKAEFTVQPEYGLDVGHHDSFASVMAVSESGNVEAFGSTTSFWVNEYLFSGVLPIAPIKYVTNGVQKSEEGLHLPEYLEVYGAEGASTYMVAVEWDVKNARYDPEEKEAQTFLVKGKLKLDPELNNDNLDTTVSVQVQVNAYAPLAAPVIDSVRVIRNYAMPELWDKINDAYGYQFVTVKDAEDLKKGIYTAVKETTDLSAEVKYIPKGTHLLYCRSFKRTEKGIQYGAWSEGKEIEINATTPPAPVIEKATVKNCDVLLKISTPEAVEGFDAVLASASEGTEPVDYALVKTLYPGDSREILLRGAAKGTYLVGIHSYRREEGYKVLSRWSNLVKVTVKNGKVTIAPSVDKVTVSGKTVTVQSSLPKGTQGYDWVLAKNCHRTDEEELLEPYDYAYIQKNKTSNKIVFKNVKPGTYYLSGHGYLRGYKKNFTNWAKTQKIVIK